MSACEKCWSDAYHRMLAHPGKGQAEHYRELIEERKDSPCTPWEQAGAQPTPLTHDSEDPPKTPKRLFYCVTCKTRHLREPQLPYDDWTRYEIATPDPPKDE